MQKNYRPGGVGMFAALPGTYLVNVYFDDNQVEVVRANLIGWQVSADRHLTPLLIDSRALDMEPWHVLHPDGRVEGSDGGSWPDLASWIDEERREARQAA